MKYQSTFFKMKKEKPKKEKKKDIVKPVVKTSDENPAPEGPDIK